MKKKLSRTSRISRPDASQVSRIPEQVGIRKGEEVPPQEISSTWQGKAQMCRWCQDLYSFFNAVGLCFPMAGRLAIGPTYLARLLSAYTGQKTTPQDIMKSGERIFTIFKSYAVRQGQSRKDDNLPDRFYEVQLPDGPRQGAKLSRETIEPVLDEYYQVRGWDKRSGRPTAEKLNELGLGDVARELLKLGILP